MSMPILCKFSQIKTYFSIILFTAFAATTATYGKSVRVDAQNLTSGAPASGVESVRVVNMGGGMEELFSLKNPKLPVTLHDIPDAGGPFMLQLKFQGVTYSEIIGAEAKAVSFEVYNTTNRYSSGIIAKKYYRMRYIDNYIQVYIMYYFKNDTLMVYSDKTSGTNEKGMIVYIPPDAESVDATASLGEFHGDGSYRSLKVTPAETSEANLYILNQALKPGEKIYELSYLIPYDGESATIELYQRNPLTEPAFLNIYTEDLEVSIPGHPDAASTEMIDSQLGGRVIKLPNIKGKIRINVSGGTPAVPENENQGGDIEIKPAFPTWLKIVFPVAITIIFIGLFIYLSNNPTWLQVYRMKQATRLKIELKVLKELEAQNPDDPSFAEKIATIEGRLESMDNKKKG